MLKRSDIILRFEDLTQLKKKVRASFGTERLKTSVSSTATGRRLIDQAWQMHRRLGTPRVTGSGVDG
jgi:hypothetical protein